MFSCLRETGAKYNRGPEHHEYFNRLVMDGSAQHRYTVNKFDKSENNICHKKVAQKNFNFKKIINIIE